MNPEQLKSLEEVHRLAKERAEKVMENDPVRQRWLAAKRIMWLLLLGSALVLYYLLSQLEQALNVL